MDEAKATELARPYLSKHETVAVQSDGVIYLDSDLILASKTAKEHNLELFIIKGEMPETPKSKK